MEKTKDDLEQELLGLRQQLEESLAEIDSSKERIQELTKEVEAYRDEGLSTEELHKKELAKAQSDLKAALNQVDSLQRRIDLAEIRAKYPDADPEFIQGSTKQEMEASAKRFQDKINEARGRKAEDQTQQIQNGFNSVPQNPQVDHVPALKGDGDLQKQLDAERAKGAKADSSLIAKLSWKLGLSKRKDQKPGAVAPK